jgi:hypothetical protein
VQLAYDLAQAYSREREIHARRFHTHTRDEPSPEMAVRIAKVSAHEQGRLIQQTQYELVHDRRDRIKLKRREVIFSGIRFAASNTIRRQLHNNNHAVQLSHQCRSYWGLPEKQSAAFLIRRVHEPTA